MKKLYFFVMSSIFLLQFTPLLSFEPENYVPPSLDVGQKTEPLIIRLGAILSLTGAYKDIAIHVKRGYTLSVEQINKRGGINIGRHNYKLEIIYQDDASNAEKAQEAAEKLIKDHKIQFLLGPYGSGLSKAIYPIAEKYKIPLIQSQGAAQEFFNPHLQYVFSVLSPAEKYLQPAVNLLGELALSRGRKPQNLKVAIIVKSDAGIQDVRRGIFKAGDKWDLKIGADILLENYDQDIKPALDKIKSSFPDLLLISVLSGHTRQILEDIAAYKMNLPMIAMTHCQSSGIEHLKQISNYTICSVQWDPYLNYQDYYFGSSVDYTSLYTAKYKGMPPYQSASASVAVTLFAKAFEKAQSIDREKVKQALEKLKIETMYGILDLTDKSNSERSVILYQLLKGQYKTIFPIKDAWAHSVYPIPSWSERSLE